MIRGHESLFLQKGELTMQKQKTAFSLGWNIGFQLSLDVIKDRTVPFFIKESSFHYVPDVPESWSGSYFP